MISCYHLSIPSPRGTLLFDDVSFEISDGSWVEITGPSGCGKSALFALMSLQRSPEQGMLVVQGRNLPRCTPAKIAQLRRALGVCEQLPRLLEDRTVVENLLLPFIARGATRGAPEQVHEGIERAGLAALANLPASALTQPERRMVGILRATLGNPAGVLIDGGLDGLDEGEKKRAQQLLRAAHRQGSTIFLFGHSWTGSTSGRGVELRIANPHIDYITRSLQAPTPELSGGRRR
jgi:ABC-type ATPase involved in cell division